jgi:hypothetical protein
MVVSLANLTIAKSLFKRPHNRRAFTSPYTTHVSYQLFALWSVFADALSESSHIREFLFRVLCVVGSPVTAYNDTLRHGTVVLTLQVNKIGRNVDMTVG